jgi:hypothetical protein
MAAVIEAATAAANATIGAGAAIIFQRFPWSRGAVTVARAATIAPSGVVVVAAAAATAAAVATTAIAAMMLLLLLSW